MTARARVANGLWLGACLPEAARFERALRNVEKVQRALLARIVRENRHTRFGKEHGFRGIDSVEAFRRRVPVRGYDDLAPYIDAIARGERDVLTPGQPERLIPSSGSAAARKWIPYTPALARQFRIGIAPWVADMMRNHPRMLCGRAYWSISPSTIRTRMTPGGIPIGFGDDTAYFGRFVRRLVGRTMAVPPDAGTLDDMETVRYVTLAFLLAARDLAFVSVWNPTFLSLLLEPLDGWAQRLARDLAEGILSPPRPLPPAVGERLAARLGRHRARAREIEDLFSAADGSDRSLYERLWPGLGLISCWTGAAAARPAAALRERFPNTPVAPKGLLATEGIVTIPLEGLAAPALAVRSHFFEFLPEDGDPVPAWALRDGGRYTVVMTTGGGLYRYCLGDVVEVRGFSRRCPLLEFVGKGDKVSDLYGEKIHEACVAGIVESVVKDLGEPGAFALLVPSGEPMPDRYTLYLAADRAPTAAAMGRAQGRVEAGLCANVHYAHCRAIGQLKAAEVRWLPGGAARAYRKYHEACLARGRQAGSIKSAFLEKDAGLGAILREPAPVRPERAGGSGRSW